MHRKILIADDSSTIRRIVEHTFASREVEVILAEDGKEAVELAREERPDVALIDILMPKMTGYEVSEALGKEPSTESIPVILLTGAFEPFDEERARECGAVDSLAKPFEGQVLVAAVEAALEGGVRSRSIPVEREVSADEDWVLGEMTTPVVEDTAAEPDGDDADLPLGEVVEVSSDEVVVQPEDESREAPEEAPVVSPEEERALVVEDESSAEEPEREAWSLPSAPLPGDEDFDLGPPPKAWAPPASPPSEAEAGEDLSREELHGVVRELAPEILREVAWEVLPDLLETLIRESAGRPADRDDDETGDQEA